MLGKTKTKMPGEPITGLLLPACVGGEPSHTATQGRETEEEHVWLPQVRHMPREPQRRLLE